MEEKNDNPGRPNIVQSSEEFKVLLQWRFLRIECIRNGCRLLFIRIFEYVIWFRRVFTVRLENRIFRHYWLHECSWSFAWFSKNISHSASKNVPVFLASEVYLERVKCFLSKKMNFQCNKVVSVDYLNNINCWATLTDFTKSYSIPCRQVKANYLEPTTPSSYITPYDFYLQHYCCCFAFNDEGIKTNDLQTLNCRDD